MSAVVEKEKDCDNTGTGTGLPVNAQLRSLLGRFATKVLDRDPTLTRDKAMALFKQALAESGSSRSSNSNYNNNNGSGSLKGDKIGSGGGADDGKLLMQIPEMIDVIQTDFLFALSVSVCESKRQNRSVYKVSKSIHIAIIII